MSAQIPTSDHLRTPAEWTKILQTEAKLDLHGMIRLVQEETLRFAGGEHPITPSEYMAFTRTTAVHPESNTGTVLELMYLGLGLAGEGGEVANKIKKLHRDAVTVSDATPGILGELGDAMWYLTRIADTLGFSLEEVMTANRDKLLARKANGKLHGEGDYR